MIDKKIYKVYLYEDGSFVVEDSEEKTTLNNNISWFNNKHGRGICKQSYKEDIENVKLFLIDHKIKECNEEIKNMRKQLKIYEKSKDSLMDDIILNM